MDNPARRSLRWLPYLALGVVFVAGTGPFFGYWRAVVAFVVAAGALALGVSYFRSAGQSAPDPSEVDVAGADLHYVCGMCGLELTVVTGPSDRPPTHCREKMQLVVASGKPPLKGL